MGTPLLWIAFNLFILVAIALDLRVLHRKPHQVRLREAGLWTAIWIAVSLLFGAGVFYYFGRQPALEYFTGYLIEKALSVDNLFLFLVIFRAFSVDERVQHRLLEWGVIGALVMRGVMIAAGAELVEHFSWMMYVFGAFLVYAGIHMLFVKKEKEHPENSRIFRLANRHLRVTHDYHGERFFVRHAGKLFATPLFLVLLVVEITDVTLAIDSIPAIFGITHDPFIVYTSNVFAILGLRAMYFLLAGVLGRLRFLTAGLSVVLVFIGGKMIAERWIEVPVHVSLGIVAGILVVSLLASLLLPAKAKAAQARPAAIPPHIAANALASNIAQLTSPDLQARESAARAIYREGRNSAVRAVEAWWSDSELSVLLHGSHPEITVGLAVDPPTFQAIHAANGLSPLAQVPPDQDAQEFELHFADCVALDVLTSKEPGGTGAIARYLAKFGAGIQQVEFACRNVDRAAAILHEKFALAPVYPATRPGANGTRINFFLVTASDGSKVLIELYEPADSSGGSRTTQH